MEIDYMYHERQLKPIDYKELGKIHRSFSERAKQLWPWEDSNSRNYQTAFEKGARWCYEKYIARTEQLVKERDAIILALQEERNWWKQCFERARKDLKNENPF